MASYKLAGDTELDGVTRINDDGSFTNFNQNSGSLWAEYESWKSEGNTPDPEFTIEEKAQIDYENRQDARIAQLRQDAVELFEFILAIFQVGRDNGAWVAQDFDQAIRDKAAEWIQTIDDYRNDSPGS